MMDYADILENVVKPKIEKYGKVVYLRRPATSTTYVKEWDAATQRYKWTLKAAPHTVVYTDPSGVAVDTAGHAVEIKYDQMEINGTTVQAGDRRFKTADLDSPTTADKLVVDGTMLTIISVRAIQPGDTVLLWDLQCRGT